MGITGRRRRTPRTGRSPRPAKTPAASAGNGARRSARDRALARVRTASLLRLRVGFLLIAMVVSVFAVRLFQLQGLDAASYAAQARAVGAVQEVLPATRGSITDRNGEPLAESLDGMMIVADPTKTRDDAAAIASILEDRLGIDYIAAVENLAWPDENVNFRYIARRVPSTKATSVVADLTEMGYRGLDTRRDPLRSYPAKDVGANLVGWINDEGNGADGAELLFSKLLAGKDGSATYDIGGGNRIPLGDNSVTDPVDGQDVALTIDRDVQWYTQRVLRQTVEDVGAESGSAVVMDTRTGQLLSLADYPSFDPNTVTSAIDTWRLGSRSLREVYEPGSVEKVLTMAALIDAGRVTPRTELMVPSQLVSNGLPINDHYEHAAAAPDAHRRAGEVLQHRHGARRPHPAPGAAAALPDQVRPGHAQRPRGLRRAAGHPRAGLVVERHRARQHRLRPGRRGQRGADDRGGQHHRQRRHLRAAEHGAGQRRDGVR